jgi:hypothetical protein
VMSISMMMVVVTMFSEGRTPGATSTCIAHIYILSMLVNLHLRPEA